MAHHGVSPSFELPEDLGFSEDSTPPQPSATSIGKHRPNSSSSGSIDKAKQWISLVPKKHSFEETLLDMQHANLEAINSRARAEMCMQEHQMLLKEFEAGIWTREEYKKRLMELTGGPSKKIHLTSENDE
ncbi:hypothetical protein EDC04DRAFT_2823910 [Pisolithus marmoratus]|nr:hypothetical protein EDC04DRAFT_2823910 [Pisolithus marmoratus]